MEAAPTLKLGRFQKVPGFEPSPFGFEFYEGRHLEGHPLVVGVAGLDPRDQVDSIGTLSAGLLAQELLTRFRPTLLINAGTAGGFHSQGGAIGDVYLGQSPAVFHDRRIHLPGNFPRYGEGHRKVHHDARIAELLGLKSGIVSTGDSLDCTADDLKHLLRLGASVKEMEAAAIARVCEAYDTPLILLKAITDIVDSHPELEGISTEEQFLKNYALAVRNLTEKLSLLVSYTFSGAIPC
jgi:nucleoside phosphorylase